MTLTLRNIIFVASTLLFFSGCAGLQNGKPSAQVGYLPETVPESFHCGIHDEATRRYLTTTDPATLPSSCRVEIVVLQELAKVSSEKELQEVFDRLWGNNSEVRELVNHPNQKESSARPLALIYYLLSAMPGSTWQSETAERLYVGTLSRLEPPQLSGYALSFYTLALLMNLKTDAAMPYLMRLEHLTPPQVYLNDLTTALGFAMNAGGCQASKGLIFLICKTSVAHNLELPQPQLRSAVAALKSPGQLSSLMADLTVLNNKHPTTEIHAFVKFIKEFWHSFDQEPVILSADGYSSKETGSDKFQTQIPGPCALNDAHQLFNEPTMPDEHSNRSVHDKNLSNRNDGDRFLHLPIEPVGDSCRDTAKLRLEILVIKAGRESDYTDPALGKIAEELKRAVTFSSYTMVRRRNFHLKINEKGTLSLDGRYWLRVVPLALTPAICRIEIAVLDCGRELLNTVVESTDGGTTVIGGPPLNDQVLLIRLKAFILMTTISRSNREMKKPHSKKASVVRLM